MEKSTFNISTLALITLLVSFGITGFTYADSMEAKRHMARGAAAMEEAKSPADFQDAVEEFSEVVKLASDWADAWFNLGTAQASAEQYQAAIKSFKTYLEKSPNASDTEAVQTRIFKLEYKMEKAEKRMDVQRTREEEKQEKYRIKRALSGMWSWQRISYSHRHERPTFLFNWDEKGADKVRVTVRGDLFEMEQNNFSLYRATISGFKLNGERIPLTNQTKIHCGFSDRNSPLEGEISPDGKMILLIVRGTQQLSGADCRFDKNSYFRSRLLTR